MLRLEVSIFAFLDPFSYLTVAGDGWSRIVHSNKSGQLVVVLWSQHYVKKDSAATSRLSRRTDPERFC